MVVFVEISKDVRAVSTKLKVMDGTVDMVEKNRPKFPHIKDPELASRKRIVKDLQSSIDGSFSRLQFSDKSICRGIFVRNLFLLIHLLVYLFAEIKASIESTAVRRKVEDDANKANRDSYNEGVKGMGSIERENQRFIKDQQQVVKAQMDSQDIALVELGRGVDTLHKLGTDINQELSEQNIMLGKLETDVEDAQERMNTVQAALSKLLKTKDGCQIWTIVILFLILVILVALVIWT